MPRGANGAMWLQGLYEWEPFEHPSYFPYISPFLQTTERYRRHSLQRLRGVKIRRCREGEGTWERCPSNEYRWGGSLSLTTRNITLKECRTEATTKYFYGNYFMDCIIYWMTLVWSVLECREVRNTNMFAKRCLGWQKRPSVKLHRVPVFNHKFNVKAIMKYMRSSSLQTCKSRLFTMNFALKWAHWLTNALDIHWYSLIFINHTLLFSF